MRVIIIAAGKGGGDNALDERYLVPMVPLVDRPFLQHIIEYLMGRGGTHFDLVLSHLADKADSWLGDGTRWGNEWADRIQVRLVQDPERPYGILRHMHFDPGEKVLLLHGDTLPQLEDCSQAQWERYFCRDGWWSGCALLDADRLRFIPENLDRWGVENWVRGEIAAAEVGEVLAVATYEGLMEAHWTVLSGHFPGLMLTGREVEEGVWLSRNVNLHPSVKIEGPVYIGENCRITSGVVLGPGVVIGRDCVLDKKCKVENAILLPRSYVGQSLDLVDVVVDKSFVVNFRLGSAIAVPDDFILAGIGEHQVSQWLVSWSIRLLAVLILVLAWPLMLATAAWFKIRRRGGATVKHEFVRLPAAMEESEWHSVTVWSFNSTGKSGHFFTHFLPGLLNVVRGEIRLVGLKPRTKAEVRDLPPDWRGVYLRGHVGIISEADLQEGALQNEEERYAADAFQVATGSASNSIRIFFRYLAK
jgi:NDP-sugar pyrophosphorylase family protein